MQRHDTDALADASSGAQPEPAVIAGSEPLPWLDLRVHALAHPSRVMQLLGTGAVHPGARTPAGASAEMAIARALVREHHLPLIDHHQLDRSWKGALLEGWSAVQHVLQWIQQGLLARWARLAVGKGVMVRLRAELGEDCYDEAIRQWEPVSGWRPPAFDDQRVLDHARDCASAVLARIVGRHAPEHEAWWRLMLPVNDDVIWRAVMPPGRHPSDAAAGGTTPGDRWGVITQDDLAVLEHRMHQVFEPG